MSDKEKNTQKNKKSARKTMTKKEAKKAYKDMREKISGAGFLHGLKDSLQKRGYESVIEDEDMMKKCVKAASKMENEISETKQAVRPHVKRASGRALKSILEDN